MLTNEQAETLLNKIADALVRQIETGPNPTNEDSPAEVELGDLINQSTDERPFWLRKPHFAHADYNNYFGGES